MPISRRQFLRFLTSACLAGLPIGSLAATPHMMRAAAKPAGSSTGAGTQDEVTTGQSGPKKAGESDSPSGGSQSSTKPGSGGGARR